MLFLYDDNGGRIGVQYNGANYLYVYNAQGDVIAIVDANHNVVVKYTYDEWGNKVSVTGSMAGTLGVQNPFRYRGYCYDEETGWYYLQSRYYDPVTGRFINADGQINDGVLGANLFAYCENNPVNMVDYDGNDPTPAWAVRINTGKGTTEDFAIAMAVYNSGTAGEWAGSAAAPVRNAIDKARASYMPNGGSLHGGYLDHNQYLTTTVNSIQYITPDDAKSLYVKELESGRLNNIDGLLAGAGILDFAVGTKLTGGALLVFETGNYCAQVYNQAAVIDPMKKAYDNNQGLVVIQMSYSAPRSGGFYTYYVPWDGEYGSYPYANHPYRFVR